MFEEYEEKKQKIVQYVQKCIDIASQCGSEQEARNLESQLLELKNFHFNIAIVGNIKRGKSTLVNTLLGQTNDNLSPIDTKVCTGGIVHYLDLSELPQDDDNHEPHARVFLNNQDEPLEIDLAELASYVKEDSNPDNCKGVDRVEVYGHFPLLHSCSLVDTPGADAMIKHHGEAVYSFLPNADAVIMTVMAGMAMTNNEQKMLKVLSAEQQRKIFYVLTKVDTVLPAAVPQIMGHMRNAITTSCGLTPPSRIYDVACQKIFAARCSGASQAEIDNLMQEWGVARLQKDLEKFIMAHSEQGVAMANRLRVAVKSAEEFIAQKLKENETLIEMQDIDVDKVHQDMERARKAFDDFESSMNSRMDAFSKKWDREVERGLGRLDIVADKTEQQVQHIISSAGLLKSMTNAFGLSKVVNEQIMPAYNEFAEKEKSEFEQLLKVFSEDMQEEVNIFAKRMDSINLSSSTAATLIGAAASYAIGGAFSAVGAAISGVLAVGTSGLVATLFGGPLATLLLGIPVVLANLPAVLIGLLALKGSGPLVRYCSSLFVPGQVKRNVEYEKKAFSAQAEKNKRYVLSQCETAIADSRAAMEFELRRLEDKLSNFNPEDKQRAIEQNEALKLIVAPNPSC